MVKKNAPVDVIYVASNREETKPGASGQVQDHQEHHRDDQEQLLDNFYEVLRRFKRLNKDLLFTDFNVPLKGDPFKRSSSVLATYMTSTVGMILVVLEVVLRDPGLQDLDLQ